MLVLGGIRLRVHNEHIGVRSIGDPELGTVQNVPKHNHSNFELCKQANDKDIGFLAHIASLSNPEYEGCVSANQPPTERRSRVEWENEGSSNIVQLLPQLHK